VYLPQVIKSFQNYSGVATTFYPILVFDVVISACNSFTISFLKFLTRDQK
jgi:hypothetical protein